MGVNHLENYPLDVVPPLLGQDGTWATEVAVPAMRVSLGWIHIWVENS